MRRRVVAGVLLGALMAVACTRAVRESEPPWHRPPPLDEWQSATSVRCAPAERPIARASATRALELDSVHRAAARQSPEIRDCYERALARDRDLLGRVVVRVGIEPRGAVTSVCVVSSDVPSPWLEACMVGAIQSWRFPAVSGEDPISILYPFVLQPTHAQSQ